jgi:anti-sigma regulatory factor (Ser/Thr protein kinase)
VLHGYDERGSHAGRWCCQAYAAAHRTTAALASVDLEAVALAVSEAVTNAVVHAYRHRETPRQEDRVNVRVTADADGVWIVLGAASDDCRNGRPAAAAVVRPRALPYPAAHSSSAHTAVVWTARNRASSAPVGAAMLRLVVTARRPSAVAAAN